MTETTNDFPEVTPAEQEVMFEIFEYGARKASFLKIQERSDESEFALRWTPEYQEALKAMADQDKKLRRMLIALRR